MDLISYPARIAQVEPGEFLVTFADLPEAGTSGQSFLTALYAAPEALSVALETYLDLGREPPPQRLAGPGEVDVPVEPAVAARLLLLRAMNVQQLTKVGLAQRMGKDEKVVRRILAGQNVSLDLILDALRAVGVRPALAVPTGA